jgi:signal transduction histidine kinase
MLCSSYSRTVMAATRQRGLNYICLLAAAFIVAVAASWFLGAQADHYAYDFLFRLHRPAPWKPQSVILAIDEATLRTTPGGIRGIRRSLASALPLVAATHPSAVVIDVILADKGESEDTDSALATVFRSTPNLVLGADLTGSGWDLPRPEFAQYASAIGHVHAQPDDDGVTRAIPLEKRYGKQRYWALCLEAFRLSRGEHILESSKGDLAVGSVEIPAPMSLDGRLMRIRFAPEEVTIPQVSLQALLADHSLAMQFTGRAVFVGVTAITEVADRLSTPYSAGRQTTGIEINANAFETLAQGAFITDVASVWVLLCSLAVTALMGLAFRYLPGWMAYAGAGLVLLLVTALPYIFFTQGRFFSLITPFSAAWLSFVSAAGYYHLVVRRNWQVEQATRARYQQAMHFVTHEMRTPLSAIQGSSELMSRYALTEEKRKQIAELINSESKRLARMVEIFLNVERLSAGQMELKRESVDLETITGVCLIRVGPLAERKHMSVSVEPFQGDLRITGDRELMEYACYNLLTNAIKYSPERTQVTVRASHKDGNVRVSVEDEGIGMDQKEVKQIFQKFYRTRKAEESGEAGTGIGLSIVQQIVEQHGGRIDVVSQPGVGSCFTLVLPAAETAAAAQAEER